MAVREVYQTSIHREAYKSELGEETYESFPAILIANLHLNAGSWKTKVQAIDQSALNAAKDNNVLIIRIEDLIYYWYKIEYLGGSREELLKTLLSSSGWLEVKKDGRIQLH